MAWFSGDRQEKLLGILHRACDGEDAARLREALAAGAEVNGRIKSRTALQRAADKQFEEGVRILLENKADPNLKRDDGSTCLIAAAIGGHTEIAKLLLDHGADVNAARKDGQTALHLAAYYGRGDLVKLLLAKGADPKTTDNRMNTAADAASGRYSRIGDLILSKEKEGKADVVHAPVVPAGGWRLTAKDEVSNVTEKPEIGYKLTEIFNFGAGIYTRIAHNVKTGAESQSLRFFDEFTDHALLDRAREALIRLGGEAPAGKLDKPSLTPRPSGGAP